MENISTHIEKRIFAADENSLNKLQLTLTLAATPQKIYNAWLNGREHTRFTGGKASASAKVNGKFTAWDGYISDKNLELANGKKIVQAWRTTEFPPMPPTLSLKSPSPKNRAAKLH